MHMLFPGPSQTTHLLNEHKLLLKKNSRGKNATILLILKPNENKGTDTINNIIIRERERQ